MRNLFSFLCILVSLFPFLTQSGSTDEALAFSSALRRGDLGSISRVLTATLDLSSTSGLLESFGSIHDACFRINLAVGLAVSGLSSPALPRKQIESVLVDGLQAELQIEQILFSRLQIAKTLHWIVATSDGTSTQWKNYERASELDGLIYDLHRQVLARALEQGLDESAVPCVPMSVYDFGLNHQVCIDPFTSPLSHGIQCGTATHPPQPFRQQPDLSQPMQAVYLDLMKRSLSNYVHLDLSSDFRGIVEGSIAGADCSQAGGRACEHEWDLTWRSYGFGEAVNTSMVPTHTTLSTATLTHLQLLVEHVLHSGVQGDLIEAGVFRGGATIFMRAILRANAVTDRSVWVADSFAGIPLSRRSLESVGVVDGEECDSWEERYAVTEAAVRSNFRRYGLLDDQVHVVPGFFNESLPPLFGPEGSAGSEARFAVIRIDADAYDGVRDALEGLYPRLSPGGVVIIDDWHLPAAAAAVHEYRRHHAIDDPIFLTPSDFVFTCSLFHCEREACKPLNLGALSKCEHPRTSLYFYNKDFISSLRPHVAYWFKSH